MTVEKLMRELRKIVKVHPEAKDANIVAYETTYYGDACGRVYIAYIGYDKRHKLLKLEG